MSTTTIPRYLIPNRGKDPITTFMGSSQVTFGLNELIDDADTEEITEIWEAAKERISDICDNWLDANDEYLNNIASNVWSDFSVWTGNTRGALEYKGEYPETDLEFNKTEWFRPKILTNLSPRSVTVSWEVHGTKHHPKDETRTKTYYYAPGSLKVKITGDDYAPYIPSPPHGGGKIDMLIAVFEEMKDAEWNKIAKSKGI